MNPMTLPFDEADYLTRLERWVRCESPTWDSRAVGAMLDLAAGDLAILGASIERIAGTLGFAGAAVANILTSKLESPILLHMGFGRIRLPPNQKQWPDDFSRAAPV